MPSALLTPFIPAKRATELRQQGSLATEVAKQSLISRIRQSQNALVSVGIACAAVGLLYALIMPIWRPLCWLLPLFVLQVLYRLFSLRSGVGIENFDADAIARTERQHTLATISLALAIGSGIWWTGLGYAHSNIWYVTTIIQCIYAIGSTTNTGTHKPTAMFAIWLNLGSAALFWFMAGISELGAAISLTTLAIYLSGYAQVVQRNFAELVAIRFENIDLIRKLEVENEIAEAARREAEQANLTKSQFLAAASHDLRQPLHALMLFSSLLDESTPEQRKILMTHIRSAADTLNHLFGGLLDLSRLDAGAIEHQLTSVNLLPLTESLGSEFGAKARQKGLLFDLEAFEIAAITDPFLLERILRNLLDNAVKYTERGFIKLSVKHSDSRVTINVEDSGCGIPAEFQSQVFNEFFQLGNPSRNSEHGTGLGLSIVRRLCELLGHQYGLDSRKGGGSRFFIELLPAALPNRETAVQRITVDHQALHGIHVLLIDDDAHVRAAMERLLQNWHCEVTSAASLTELESATSDIFEPPHALIADYRLTDHQTGYDAIHSARQRWPTIAAAIFTGDTHLHTPAQHFKEVPIFQKPVEADRIAQWLLTALRDKPTRI